MTSICQWVSRGVVILIALCRCVLSVEKKLVNTAMVPSKLKRHFTTNHSHLFHKTTDYFKRLLESQVQQSKVFEKKVWGHHTSLLATPSNTYIGQTAALFRAPLNIHTSNCAALFRLPTKQQKRCWTFDAIN